MQGPQLHVISKPDINNELILEYTQTQNLL